MSNLKKRPSPRAWSPSGSAILPRVSPRKGMSRSLSDPDLRLAKLSVDDQVRRFINSVAVMEGEIAAKLLEIAETFIIRTHDQLNARQTMKEIRDMYLEHSNATSAEKELITKLMFLISNCSRLEAMKEFASDDRNDLPSPSKPTDFEESPPSPILPPSKVARRKPASKSLGSVRNISISDTSPPRKTFDKIDSKAKKKEKKKIRTSNVMKTIVQTFKKTEREREKEKEQNKRKNSKGSISTSPPDTNKIKPTSATESTKEDETTEFKNVTVRKKRKQRSNSPTVSQYNPLLIDIPNVVVTPPRKQSLVVSPPDKVPVVPLLNLTDLKAENINRDEFNFDTEKDWLMCRICEEEIEASLFADHSQLCSKLMPHLRKIEKSDKDFKYIKHQIDSYNFDHKKIDGSENEYLKMIESILTKAENCSPENTLQAIGTLKKQLSLIKSLSTNKKISELKNKSSPNLNKNVYDTFPLYIIERCIRNKLKGFERIEKEMTSSPRGAARTVTPKSHTTPTISDFKFIKPIAKGGYSKVYLARKIKTGDIYAIKVLKKSFIKEKNAVFNILSEKKIMEVASSSFVVRMYYSFHTKNHLFLVMEFMPGGDCYSLLKAQRTFSEKMAKMYIAETVLALECLHNKNIVHRDVKPDNMLISGEGHIKLTDFGLSKMGLTRNLNRSSLVSMDIDNLNPNLLEDNSDTDNDGFFKGTPDYLAPEVIMGIGHDKTVDWWALGCVLYEFLVGIPPFYGCSVDETFQNILARDIEYPQIPQFMSAEAQDLIDKLLQMDVNKRLGSNGASEVKKHKFFSDINWELLLNSKQQALFTPRLKNDEDLSYFDERRKEDFPDELEMEQELSEMGNPKLQNGKLKKKNTKLRDDYKTSSGLTFSWEDLDDIKQDRRAEKYDTAKSDNDPFSQFDSVVTRSLQDQNVTVLKRASLEYARQKSSIGRSGMSKSVGTAEFNGLQIVVGP